MGRHREPTIRARRSTSLSASSRTLALGSLLLLSSAALCDEDPVALDGVAADSFESAVRPVLARYCFGCHGPDKQKADLRFDRLDPDVTGGADLATWRAMRDVLEFEEMPPSKAEQPPDDVRAALLAWIRSGLERAGDSREGEGRSPLRRLNKGAYTAALQELLGLSVDFGRPLPDDGKSELGFTNNGDVLLASPLHLELYQSIARRALERAIVTGAAPEPARYRVTFGRGSGQGLVAGTTGGYQAVPLSTDDFVVELLDADGRPQAGADDAERERMDAVRRRISVGLRGSSPERFHSVDEGVVLYGALPHKEVAPGAWQGPSPNMKLELQRVFPQEGDFVLRVEASRGYLVTGQRELLIRLDEPEPRVSLALHPADREPTADELRALEPTVFGPWFQAGPFVTETVDEARAAAFFGAEAPLDFDEPLADGVTRWVEVGAVDGTLRRYPTEIGAVFLAREIEAPGARTCELALGSDDALWAWLDGEEVLTRDVARGLAADQDRLVLELTPGRHELLLKIVNFGGGFGSASRVVHDGAFGGLLPFDLATEAGARVYRADRFDARMNLRHAGAELLAEAFPEDSLATLSVELEAGTWQFDLVHRALPVSAMGSVRFRVDDMKLDLRPEPTELELARGWQTTPIGAARLNAGRHELTLGGPFFVGFSQLVATPLDDEHPLVQRLASRVRAEAAGKTPALRAYIGTRTDDGMDYRTFGPVREVEAPLGAAEVYSFQGRLEDLPIPEPESGDDEILSGILVLGVWNDHLIKSRKENGPPLLVRSMEFEAPYHPVWPPESHRRIFFESPNSDDEEVYTRQVLGRFLERAFRRRVSEDELERYVDFWHEVRDEFPAYEHSVREVLVAALCSPSFLFLAETDGDAVTAEEALASRLSFFLWSAPPDEGLLELARAGSLGDALGQQTERLLDDPRSERFVRAFTREWLRLDRFEGMTINPNTFPAFTRFVKRDMAEETYRFVDWVLREDKSVFELLDSDVTLLNQNLAEFYGIEGVEGVAFRPVLVPKESGRGGLLGHGAFLAGHSDGNEPHPIKRAVWVKEKLLGQRPLPPPPNVPELDPTTPGFDTLTLKERIERHRDDDSCRDCHASFDPYGIALENYNAVGLLESTRKGRPIDARTVLPDGTELDGPAALVDYLVGDRAEAFVHAVVQHVYAYALGRDPEFSDEPELAAIVRQVRSEGDTMRAVLRAVVQSPSFRLP